jgi:uncharacterized membrane protein YedE/YeeE
MMGPLIPQGVIDPGWSYVIAMLIGVGFGFILESSGFSSSRKIIGLFYGYDFTVLKVFFTATIVAMLGLLYFNYAGIIDLNMVYIPPTFIQSTLIGGVLMGFGFILGGYCPGTGMCAVGIGKIDAIVFVLGLYLGIFLFSEAFPLIEPLYMQDSLGGQKITEALGIGTGLFVFLFIAIAIIGFNIAAFVQKKVKKVIDY